MRRTTDRRGCRIWCAATTSAVLETRSGVSIAMALVQLTLTAVFRLNDATFATYFVEAFPAQVRFTGFALPFNVGVALFGGVSPLAASWLIATTDDPRAPAFIIMALAALTAVALIVRRDPYTAASRVGAATEGNDDDGTAAHAAGAGRLVREH